MSTVCLKVGLASADCPQQLLVVQETLAAGAHVHKLQQRLLEQQRLGGRETGIQPSDEPQSNTVTVPMESGEFVWEGEGVGVGTKGGWEGGRSEFV